MKNKIAFLLATWFGSGYLKPAPGTWGTLAGLPFAVLTLYVFGISGLLIFIILTFAIGLWSGQIFGKASGNHDDSRIVIDEVCGMGIALIPAGLNPVLICAAFVFFRLFDIRKPFPVSYFDKRDHTIFGVMMDDVVAGVYAALFIWGLQII